MRNIIVYNHQYKLQLKKADALSVFKYISNINNKQEFNFKGE